MSGYAPMRSRTFHSRGQLKIMQSGGYCHRLHLGQRANDRSGRKQKLPLRRTPTMRCCLLNTSNDKMLVEQKDKSIICTPGTAVLIEQCEPSHTGRPSIEGLQLCGGSDAAAKSQSPHQPDRRPLPDPDVRFGVSFGARLCRYASGPFQFAKGRSSVCARPHSRTHRRPCAEACPGTERHRALAPLCASERSRPIFETTSAREIYRSLPSRRAIASTRAICSGCFEAEGG